MATGFANEPLFCRCRDIAVPVFDCSTACDRSIRSAGPVLPVAGAEGWPLRRHTVASPAATAANTLATATRRLRPMPDGNEKPFRPMHVPGQHPLRSADWYLH